MVRSDKPSGMGNICIDRQRARLWLKYLLNLSSPRLEALRLDYLKLLLIVMQRGKLFGLFVKGPPLAGELEEFPDDYKVLDLASDMLREASRRGEGDTPPCAVEVSGDRRQYLAVQEIPGFGAHAYLAISAGAKFKDWDNTENAQFPKGLIQTTDSLDLPPFPESQLIPDVKLSSNRMTSEEMDKVKQRLQAIKDRQTETTESEELLEVAEAAAPSPPSTPIRLPWDMIERGFGPDVEPLDLSKPKYPISYYKDMDIEGGAMKWGEKRKYIESPVGFHGPSQGKQQLEEIEETSGIDNMSIPISDHTHIGEMHPSFVTDTSYVDYPETDYAFRKRQNVTQQDVLKMMDYKSQTGIRLPQDSMGREGLQTVAADLSVLQEVTEINSFICEDCGEKIESYFPETVAESLGTQSSAEMEQRLLFAEFPEKPHTKDSTNTEYNTLGEYLQANSPGRPMADDMEAIEKSAETSSRSEAYEEHFFPDPVYPRSRHPGAPPTPPLFRRGKYFTGGRDRRYHPSEFGLPLDEHFVPGIEFFADRPESFHYGDERAVDRAMRQLENSGLTNEELMEDSLFETTEEFSNLPVFMTPPHYYDFSGEMPNVIPYESYIESDSTFSGIDETFGSGFVEMSGGSIPSLDFPEHNLSDVANIDDEDPSFFSAISEMSSIQTMELTNPTSEQEFELIKERWRAVRANMSITSEEKIVVNIPEEQTQKQGKSMNTKEDMTSPLSDTTAPIKTTIVKEHIKKELPTTPKMKLLHSKNKSSSTKKLEHLGMDDLMYPTEFNISNTEPTDYLELSHGSNLPYSVIPPPRSPDYLGVPPLSPHQPFVIPVTPKSHKRIILPQYIENETIYLVDDTVESDIIEGYDSLDTTISLDESGQELFIEYRNTSHGYRMPALDRYTDPVKRFKKLQSMKDQYMTPFQPEFPPTRPPPMRRHTLTGDDIGLLVPRRRSAPAVLPGRDIYEDAFDSWEGQILDDENRPTFTSLVDSTDTSLDRKFDYSLYEAAKDEMGNILAETMPELFDLDDSQLSTSSPKIDKQYWSATSSMQTSSSAPKENKISHQQSFSPQQEPQKREHRLLSEPLNVPFIPPHPSTLRRTQLEYSYLSGANISNLSEVTLVEKSEEDLGAKYLGGYILSSKPVQTQFPDFSSYISDATPPIFQESYDEEYCSPITINRETELKILSQIPDQLPSRRHSLNTKLNQQNLLPRRSLPVASRSYRNRSHQPVLMRSNMSATNSQDASHFMEFHSNFLDDETLPTFISSANSQDTSNFIAFNSTPLDDETLHSTDQTLYDFSDSDLLSLSNVEKIELAAQIAQTTASSLVTANFEEWLNTPSVGPSVSAPIKGKQRHHSWAGAVHSHECNRRHSFPNKPFNASEHNNIIFPEESGKQLDDISAVTLEETAEDLGHLYLGGHILSSPVPNIINETPPFYMLDDSFQPISIDQRNELLRHSFSLAPIDHRHSTNQRHKIIRPQNRSLPIERSMQNRYTPLQVQAGRRGTQHTQISPFSLPEISLINDERIMRSRDRRQFEAKYNYELGDRTHNIGKGRNIDFNQQKSQSIPLQSDVSFLLDQPTPHSFANQYTTTTDNDSISYDKYGSSRIEDFTTGSLVSESLPTADSQYHHHFIAPDSVTSQNTISHFVVYDPASTRVEGDFNGLFDLNISDITAGNLVDESVPDYGMMYLDGYILKNSMDTDGHLSLISQPELQETFNDSSFTPHFISRSTDIKFLKRIPGQIPQRRYSTGRSIKGHPQIHTRSLPYARAPNLVKSQASPGVPANFSLLENESLNATYFDLDSTLANSTSPEYLANISPGILLPHSPYTPVYSKSVPVHQRNRSHFRRRSEPAQYDKSQLTNKRERKIKFEFPQSKSYEDKFFIQNESSLQYSPQEQTTSDNTRSERRKLPHTYATSTPKHFYTLDAESPVSYLGSPVGHLSSGYLVQDGYRTELEDLANVTPGFILDNSNISQYSPKHVRNFHSIPSTNQAKHYYRSKSLPTRPYFATPNGPESYSPVSGYNNFQNITDETVPDLASFDDASEDLGSRYLKGYILTSGNQSANMSEWSQPIFANSIVDDSYNYLTPIQVDNSLQKKILQSTFTRPPQRRHSTGIPSSRRTTRPDPRYSHSPKRYPTTNRPRSFMNRNARRDIQSTPLPSNENVRPRKIRFDFEMSDKSLIEDENPLEYTSLLDTTPSNICGSPGKMIPTHLTSTPKQDFNLIEAESPLSYLGSPISMKTSIDNSAHATTIESSYKHDPSGHLQQLNSSETTLFGVDSIRIDDVSSIHTSREEYDSIFANMKRK